MIKFWKFFTTNSEIDLLVEDNKLLLDTVSTLENKIKHLKKISSTKDIKGSITINELFTCFSREKNFTIFNVLMSQNQTNDKNYVQKNCSNIGVNFKPTIKTIIN